MVGIHGTTMQKNDEPKNARKELRENNTGHHHIRDPGSRGPNGPYSPVCPLPPLRFFTWPFHSATPELRAAPVLGVFGVVGDCVRERAVYPFGCVTGASCSWCRSMCRGASLVIELFGESPSSNPTSSIASSWSSASVSPEAFKCFM